MGATLTRMYHSGECSVGDIAKALHVTVQTIYPHMRLLGLPLLGQPGCKLRNYRSYGPRYNEVVFSRNQVAFLTARNLEGWSDSRIARELKMPEGPVRKLRENLGLRPRIFKPIPIGHRHGNLVVLKQMSPKHKKGADSLAGLSSRSLCRCDCGRRIAIFNEDLRSGNTKTCGCRIHLRNLDSEWIRIYHSYRSGAMARGVRFSLDLSQVRQLCSMCCFYCGGKDSNIANPPRRSHPTRTPLAYNGIDQVVPCGGYRCGNVLPCCRFCNRAKDNLPLNMFLFWIQRIFRRPLTTASVQQAAASLGDELRRREPKQDSTKRVELGWVRTK